MINKIIKLLLDWKVLLQWQSSIIQLLSFAPMIGASGVFFFFSNASLTHLNALLSNEWMKQEYLVYATYLRLQIRNVA